MKVLIICNDFPPLNSIGAQRPHSWLKYFHKFDHTVTVITKNWSNNSADPKSIIQSLQTDEKKTEKTFQGTVIKTPHKIIYPERLVVKYGMDKMVFWRRMMTLLYKILSFLFLRFDKNRSLFDEAKRELSNNEYDVVITTGEPFILFRYGHLLKKKFPVKWIADYRDGWYLNHITSNIDSILIKGLRAYEKLFENKYLKNADLITSIDPWLTKALGDMHNKPTACIYNGFWEFYQTLQEYDTQKKTLILTHLGTLTPGQQVEELLKVISKLQKEGKITDGDLVLNFVGLEYFDVQMHRVLNFDEGIKKFIKTTPRLPRQEAVEIAAASDYLISFTQKNYKAIYAKNYDYVSVKKPILVVPSDNSLLRDFVTELGLGVCFENDTDLYNYLADRVEDKKNGRQEEFSVDSEKASFYTRENQAEIFARKISEL